MLCRAISQNDTVCYQQSLNDDETFEETEFTGLSLIITEMEVPTIIDRANTVIEIHDNDSKPAFIEKYQLLYVWLWVLHSYHT